jgi:hypothetical protein
MSAGLSGVGPVSVRYAVQIRELLQSQSAKRAAAEQEAARADAAARAEAARKAAVDALRSSLKLDAPKTEAVKVDVKIDARIEPAPVESEAPHSAPAKPAPIATADVASGQLVDIEA